MRHVGLRTASAYTRPKYSNDQERAMRGTSMPNENAVVSDMEETTRCAYDEPGNTAVVSRR